MIGAEVSFFDTVNVGKNDKEGGESAADLDADDLLGFGFRELVH
jgi:hypothetical protein